MHLWLRLRTLCILVSLPSPRAIVVLAPLAHATGVALAGFHAAAVTGFHAGAACHAVSAAFHAAGAAKVAGGAIKIAGTMTAAPGAVTVGARALTHEMQRPERPRTAQAVGRIIQVEFDRLVEAAWCGSRRPSDVLKRVRERVIERGPIITWALDVWLQDQLATLPGYCQVVQARIPGIWAAVRALEVELTSQIKFGLTTAPWRVLRLVYSTWLVVLCALVGQVFKLPDLAWAARLRARLQKRLQTEWPVLVDQLAATLEINLKTDPSRVVVSSRARRNGARWRALFPLCERVSAFLPSRNGAQAHPTTQLT